MFVRLQWDYSILFLVLSIAYIVLLVSVAHTLAFGIVAFQKINEPKTQAQPTGA